MTLRDMIFLFKCVRAGETVKVGYQLHHEIRKLDAVLGAEEVLRILEKFLEAEPVELEPKTVRELLELPVDPPGFEKGEI